MVDKILSDAQYPQTKCASTPASPSRPPAILGVKTTTTNQYMREINKKLTAFDRFGSAGFGQCDHDEVEGPPSGAVPRSVLLTTAIPLG